MWRCLRARSEHPQHQYMGCSCIRSNTPQVTGVQWRGAAWSGVESAPSLQYQWNPSGKRKPSWLNKPLAFVWFWTKAMLCFLSRFSLSSDRSQLQLQLVWCIPTQVFHQEDEIQYCIVSLWFKNQRVFCPSFALLLSGVFASDERSREGGLREGLHRSHTTLSISISSISISSISSSSTSSIPVILRC